MITLDRPGSHADAMSLLSQYPRFQDDDDDDDNKAPSPFNFNIYVYFVFFLILSFLYYKEPIVLIPSSNEKLTRSTLCFGIEEDAHAVTDLFIY